MSLYDPPNLRLAGCCYTCSAWVEFCDSFRCTKFLGDRIASHVCDAWEPQVCDDPQKNRLKWQLESNHSNP